MRESRARDRWFGPGSTAVLGRAEVMMNSKQQQQFSGSNSSTMIEANDNDNANDERTLLRDVRSTSIEVATMNVVHE